MKKQFIKRQAWHNRDHHDFRYSHCSGGYHRAIRTFPEIRRNASDEIDPELRDMRFRVRGNRAYEILTSWNDPVVSRNWGRSWKDFTKFPKQWMRDGRPVRNWKGIIVSPDNDGG